MRKIIIYTSISFLFLLSDCRNRNVNVAYLRPIKDSITTNINLYECDKYLYGMLDSIVLAVTNCSLYTKVKVEFFITVYLNERGDTLMSVESTPLWNIPDFTGCKGIFYYKGYSFNYFGVFLTSFFIDTNKSIKKRIINPEKLMPDIDDTVSFWCYIVNNEVLKCINYKNCENWWVDENYAPKEDSL